MLSVSKRLRWLLALTGVVMIMPAYGYLDGNSGSIIVQALLGGVAGILAVLKLYWHKLKSLVLRLVGKAPAEQQESDTTTSDDVKNHKENPSNHDKS